MKELLYTGISVLLCLSAASARTYRQDSSRTYYGTPVVVTGTREELSERLVPASISVVSSRELLASGGISLLDALSERVPGLFVARRGVIGYGINSQAGTITIRGLGGSPNTQVLVMIDGVPQFMGLFGHPLPDSYLSEDAERVEVIRGPASVLYGTNAMGGVVNIITGRNRETGTSLKGSASYGSFNTREYNAAVGYGTGSLHVLLSGDHDRTDGHRPGSSFNTNDGYLNARYSIDDNFALQLNGNVNKFKTYDPGTIYSPKTNSWVDVLRTTNSVSLDTKFGNLDGSVKAFYSYGDHDVYDGFHSLDRNIGVMAYQSARPLEGSIVTVGADWRRYGGTAVNNIAGLNYGRHYSDELGVYALLQQLFFNRVMLNAGTRIQHSAVYGDELVPQAGLAWTLTGSMTLKASASKGFRSPTIREMYLFPAPNPNLEPERLWNYELSVLRSVGRSVRIELTGFIAEGSNMILTEGVYPNMRLLNSGKFTHRGIEFAGRCTPGGGVKVDASYSHIDPGSQTYSTPKQKLFIGFGYIHGGIGVNLTLQRIIDLYGADNSQMKLPDYTLLGANVSVRVAEFADVVLSGENLFNVSYQTIYGYPMPGMTLFAGLRLHTTRAEE